MPYMLNFVEVVCRTLRQAAGDGRLSAALAGGRGRLLDGPPGARRGWQAGVAAQGKAVERGPGPGSEGAAGMAEVPKAAGLPHV